MLMMTTMMSTVEVYVVDDLPEQNNDEHEQNETSDN